jgi:hypothetical protein
MVPTKWLALAYQVVHGDEAESREAGRILAEMILKDEAPVPPPTSLTARRALRGGLAGHPGSAGSRS